MTGATAIPVRERDLQEQTRQLLVLLRNAGRIIDFYHPLHSQGSQSGYPDWTIALPDSPPIWIELKTARGTLSSAQCRWANALRPHFHVARSLDDFISILRRYRIPVDLA